MSANPCQEPLAFALFFCHAEYVKKYLLPIAVFVLFIVSFFGFTPQQNQAFALNVGDNCYVSKGCGSNTLVCVPDGACTGIGIARQCNTTGICQQKNKQNGSCNPNASVCDTSAGFACQKSNCTSGTILGVRCTYTCQKQAKVTTGKQCIGSGQGNCASSQDACLPEPNCYLVTCPTTCQKKPSNTNGSSCTGNGNSTCGSVNGVQYTCAIKPGCNLITCPHTCQPPSQPNKTCTGSGQGSCSTGYTCQPDSNCSGITCGKTCQKPNAPTSNPTLPPPPLPPCQQWVHGQCVSFLSTFGSIPTSPSGFIKVLFDILLSVSGGIALLLIIKSGYQLMTSQGKPEQMQAGRDQIIAAIVGLVFLIFSFVVLQLIGYDILHIPGFGGGNSSGVNVQSCNKAGLQYCSKTQQCLPTSSTCP